VLSRKNKSENVDVIRPLLPYGMGMQKFERVPLGTGVKNGDHLFEGGDKGLDAVLVWRSKHLAGPICQVHGVAEIVLYRMWVIHEVVAGLCIDADKRDDAAATRGKFELLGDGGGLLHRCHVLFPLLRVPDDLEGRVKLLKRDRGDRFLLKFELVSQQPADLMGASFPVSGEIPEKAPKL
jgi:hypothetical protein